MKTETALPARNDTVTTTDDRGGTVPADASSPAPELSLVTEAQLLEAEAAQNAEIAAQFIRAGNRSAARAHLHRAMEQLNEAEIE